MFLTDLLFIFETSVMAAISMAKDRNIWRHPLELLGSLARLPKSPVPHDARAEDAGPVPPSGLPPQRPRHHPVDRRLASALFGADGELTEIRAG